METHVNATCQVGVGGLRTVYCKHMFFIEALLKSIQVKFDSGVKAIAG